MELGTVSILVQLLLIFALVAVFAGHRHLKARRERLRSHPSAWPAPAEAQTQPQVHAAPPAPVARPVLLAPEPDNRLVSEELLPACFADTCADWAHIEGDGRSAGSPMPTRFSLADWSASQSANELYEKNFAIVAMPGIAKPNAHIPADYEKRLVKQDLRWSAANRDKILAEWTKRYDGKSEKK